MDNMDLEMQRYAIESKEKWREIIKEIPTLNFKKRMECQNYSSVWRCIGKIYG